MRSVPIVPFLRRVRELARRTVFRLRIRPHGRSDLVRLGTDYGGWIVPSSLIEAGAVCYCVGAGEDVSFDLLLATMFGAEVHTFDPTPRSIEYVERLPQPAPIHFHPYGVWRVDSVQRFYAPLLKEHVSHSIPNLRGTTEFFEAECLSLRTIKRRLGHEDITLLKLDIEGAEHEVLSSMIEERILPAVLAVEFDQPMPLKQCLRSVDRLRAVGYRPVAVDRWNVTLVRA
jgi:FkbM family methyltransferase